MATETKKNINSKVAAAQVAKPEIENANNPKTQALKIAMDQIQKQYGKGSIMLMGDHVTEKMEVIPTGALSLDIALGVGGIPKGRIIEIYGPESSGKTTLAQHIMAEVQKAGGTAALIDAEHAFDPTYAKAIGVDVDNLILSQPDYGEQALEIVETLIRSGAVDVVVIDSVAALTPKSEIEGNMGDAQMGVQARLMSQALRKITAISNRSKTTIVFLNQIRMKIGVMFGNPETTTGGNALKFYASVRIDIRRTDKITRGDEIIGNATKVKVVKNKVSPPFKEAEFDILYGKGIDRVSSIVDAALTFGELSKSGTWFKLPDSDKMLAQGKEGLKAALHEDQQLLKSIEAKVRTKAFGE
jgi:recombination protein RecA